MSAAMPLASRKELALGAGAVAGVILGMAVASGNPLLIAAPFAIVLGLVAFLYPVVGVVTMMVFVPLEGWGSLIPGSFTLPRLIGLLTFACFAANLLATRAHIRHEASTRWFGLLVLWIFATTFWAVDRVSAYRMTFVMFQLFLFYLMCLNLLDRPAPLRWAMLSYVVGSAISSVLAIRNFTSGQYATRFLERVSSIEDMNPNDFGRMIGFGLLAGLWLLFENANRWFRLIVLSAFPLLLVALVLAKGRGAWLAFAAALLAIFLVIPRTPRVWAAAGLVVVLAAGTGMVGVYLGYFNDTLTERWEETVEGKDPTAQRLDIWRVGLALARDNPVRGVGFANFTVRFNDYLHHVKTDVFPGFNKDPHNIFIGMLGETGLVGLTLFAGIFVIVVQALRRGGRSWNTAVASGMVVFTIIAGMSGTDFIRKWFWISLITALLLARGSRHAHSRA